MNKQTKKDIVLSISMLASNRVESTKRCLDSLAPLRERVSCELIVVDTGCGPELRKLIEEYADIVTEFEWCNHFSKARNAGLALASGEWFMYLDDDEWFTDIEPMITFFESGKYKEYGSASYIQRNYLDMDGSQYSDSWVGRMIRLDEDTQFVSKIHEYLSPKRGSEIAIHAVVDHYGYVYPTEEAKWKHYKRNETLLLDMIQEEPDQVRWKMQLLLEYRGVDLYQKLIDLGTECLASYGVEVADILSDTENENTYIELLPYENMVLGTYYAAVILGYKGLGQHADVLKLIGAACKDPRNNELAHTFMALHGANAAFYCGKYEASIAYAEDYLKWEAYFSDKEELLASQQKVPFIWEVFDLVKKKEVYSLLICSGLKYNDTTNLEQYFDKLGWNEKNIYVFEEIMPVLVEALCEMPACEAFEYVLQTMQNHGPLWAYYNEELQRYQTSKMARQIKEQLNLLIGNGMYEQARTVLPQIKSLLPEDYDILELEQKLYGVN